MRGKYCGRPCQIRIDFLNPLASLDFKTSQDLDWFIADFKRYQYANQMSFYQKVAEQYTGIRYPVMVLAVEKQAPYRAGVFTVSQEALNLAQIENEDAINRLREAEENNSWPTGWEEVKEICVK
jgi:hypothetical protein